MNQIIVNHNQHIFKSLFIRYYPIKYQVFYNLEQEEYQKNKTDSLDYLDFCYRRYISGQQNTLHKVFGELRDYLNRGFEKSDIIELLDTIENECLYHEFYEVMNRVKSSRKKILKRLDEQK